MATNFITRLFVSLSIIVPNLASISNWMPRLIISPASGDPTTLTKRKSAMARDISSMGLRPVMLGSQGPKRSSAAFRDCDSAAGGWPGRATSGELRRLACSCLMRSGRATALSGFPFKMGGPRF